MTGSAGSELRLRNARKHYGGARALDGASVTVRTGEVLCLLGENGAGKSTASKILAGLERLDSGVIEIDGAPVEIPDAATAHALGIRSVPQELSLVPEMTVAENILLGDMPTGRRGLIDRNRMRELSRRRLERLSLNHIDVDAPIGSLRVVEQAFVQIARSLTPGTKFLIADEPTAPMSSAQAENLLALLQAITGAGVGVVFVSHRLDEVFRVGHRVTVLRDGRNVLEGSVSDLTKPRLVDAMAGTQVAGVESGPNFRPEKLSTVLEVRDLSAGLLQGVSFDAHAGEILGVYGGTGSGREDLGPALFGAINRSGDIRVRGSDVAGGIAAAIKAGIGYVPAERRSQGLLLDRSVSENLTLAVMDRLTRRGFVSRRAERERVAFWWEKLSLKASSTQALVGTLSGGNQQKILLARWLEVATPILVLDEPTRGVDVRTKTDIYRILREVAATGVTVVVVSSDAEELEKVCIRVLVLRDGRMTQEIDQPTQEIILRAAQEAAAA